MAMGKFHGVIRPTTPERPAAGLDQHAIALGGHVLAAETRPFAADVAQDVDRPADFAARFGQRLALFAGHLAGDLVGPRLEDVGGLVEDLAALGRRYRRPRRLRRLGRGNRLAGVVRAGLLIRRDGFAGVGRIPGFERGAVARPDPLAADQILEGHWLGRLAQHEHEGRDPSGPGTRRSAAAASRWSPMVRLRATPDDGRHPGFNVRRSLPI